MRKAKERVNRDLHLEEVLIHHFNRLNPLQGKSTVRLNTNFHLVNSDATYYCGQMETDSRSVLTTHMTEKLRKLTHLEQKQSTVTNQGKRSLSPIPHPTTRRSIFIPETKYCNESPSTMVQTTPWK